MKRLLTFLVPRSRPVVLAVTLASVVLLGLLDQLTGHQVSFALFYLLPVSLAAWSAGRGVGLAVSLASAVTWYLSNRLAGETFSDLLIPVWNGATRLGFFCIVTLLLVRLRELLEQERARSRTDFITGAHNTRAFYDLVTSEIMRAERHGRPFTVAYLDLDDFKVVNDQFGHRAGDDALRAVVRVTHRTIRRVDFVARLGGDEFGILFPETDAASAREIIPRLRDALLQEMYEHQWPVTFSIGAVTCLTPPPSVDELIRDADGLMFRAKQGGKDAVVYGTHQRGDASEELRQLRH